MTLYFSILPTMTNDLTKTERGINYSRRAPSMGMWQINKIPAELIGTDEEERLVGRTVHFAVSSLFHQHIALMNVAASERSICHKIAESLQDRYLSDYWSVDCEYNRIGKEPKRMTRGNGEDLSLVLPDIIIHNRGSNDNLAVIEVKKDTASIEQIADDVNKLHAYRKDLNYRYAFMVITGTGSDRKGKINPGVYRITEESDDWQMNQINSYGENEEL